MIRVAIIDDHSLIREGLRRIIEQEADIRVTGEASDAAEAMMVLSKGLADVVILDVSLPDKSGLDLLKEIRHAFKIHVLILSMHPVDRYGVRAIRAGALGYLTKETPGEVLIKAIRAAHSGKRFVPPSLGEALANDAAGDSSVDPHKKLSERELSIMLLIARGKTRMEIARKLNLSPETISAYRKRILQKLRLSTSVEISRYAFENHLIE